MPLFDSHSPYRIFGFSALATLAILLAVFFRLGTSALVATLILVVIEITFSFENAIINAKVLATMSRFWQMMFLTIGIVVAIFGMRIVFPIVIVALSTGLSWRSVLDLALNNPDAYAAQLATAHPSIAAFGAAFLLMLALSFFFDTNRSVLWLKKPEAFMQKFSSRWAPATITALIAGGAALAGPHPSKLLAASSVGIAAYMVIHGLAELFGSLQTGKGAHTHKVGLAAFVSFLYLELLDASFSLDGVIGAFAITDTVILIAAGLGAGALWVRSMTVYMVRKGTLKNYKYIEHGAHYTVLVLALIMLLSEQFHIPEAAAGFSGVIIIAWSIIASTASSQKKRKRRS